MRRQRGVSMSGLLFGLVVLGIIAVIGVKLVPHYVDFYTVRSIIDGVQQDPATVSKGPRAITERIVSQLYINNIKTLNRKNFELGRTRTGYDLGVAYEVREPLFGNLDAVLRFSHKVALVKP